MEDQARIYWTTIEDIEHKLSKENRTYMSKVKGYMLLSSIFHDADEVMVEHLYNMYLDVFEGQKNGLSAEEFLGDNPKAMADELLKNLPPLTVKKALDLSLMVGGIFLAFQFLAEFAGSGQIGLNMMSILGFMTLALAFPILFFLLIKQVIYQTTKWRIWGTYLLFGLLFVTALAINTWITNHLSSILLPKIWSILLALIIVVVTAIYRKEDLVKCIFLPVFLLYFFSGLLQVYLAFQGISGDFWNKWLPVGVMLLGIVLFWIGSIVLLLAKRKK